MKKDPKKPLPLLRLFWSSRRGRHSNGHLVEADPRTTPIRKDELRGTDALCGRTIPFAKSYSLGSGQGDHECPACNAKARERGATTKVVLIGPKAAAMPRRTTVKVRAAETMKKKHLGTFAQQCEAHAERVNAVEELRKTRQALGATTRETHNVPVHIVATFLLKELQELQLKVRETKAPRSTTAPNALAIATADGARWAAVQGALGTAAAAIIPLVRAVALEAAKAAVAELRAELLKR